MASRTFSSPIVELHSHLEGTIDASTLVKLATGSREHLLPTLDEAVLARTLATPGLTGFRRYFEITRPFRMSPEDIRLITRAELRRAGELGVVYAEYRFNPGGPMRRGADPWSILRVIDEELGSARDAGGPDTRLIFGVGRTGDAGELDRLLGIAREAWQEEMVCGVDLNGLEADWPTSQFVEPFRAMATIGCPVAIHAGEWDGPESIRSALECEASRIAHGVRSTEDPELVDEIVRRRITLTICPTSNVFTEVYPRVDDVPLRRLFDRGVAVTINSDDCAAFGSTVADEHALAKRVFGFTDAEMQTITQHAIEGAFLADAEKRKLSSRVSV